MKNYIFLVFALLFLVENTYADDAKSFLETIHHHSILTATVPDNGDQNPYAIVVAPVSAGKIQKGDVLVDNFNSDNNLQGTGSTVVNYNPVTKKMLLFAQVPKDLKGCPGGVGLTTAMTMLTSGWVIVGSAPSTDGTAATKGRGCLIVLDSQGNVTDTIAGENINAPWGNIAAIDNGDNATLFVTNVGFGIGSRDTAGPSATVLRIELSIPKGKPPVVSSQTVIARGLTARADKDVFLVGPTGLALGQDGTTLYVSDTLNNRIVAIDNATTRKESAGNLREVTKDGYLHNPLAMVMAPNGNVLVTNGKNGQVVEINPITGKQVNARWINKNKAQTPPGSGNLFGIAMTQDGKGFYYVQDDINVLTLAQ